MQILLKNIKTPVSASDAEIVACAVKRLQKLGSRQKVRAASVYKRSIDARNRTQICFVSSVLLDLEEKLSESVLQALSAEVFTETVPVYTFGTQPLSAPPVVVGFGPGGMFAALVLAEQGYCPVVLERGEDVDARTASVADFYRTGILNTESNVQFGAGGAGTFSDGKLVTRIHDPYCRYVLQCLHTFGAPEEVLYNAKPHIGTDRLRIVVANLRDRIRSLGGTILFSTKMTGFSVRDHHLYAVQTTAGEIPCGAVILATGHSARDIYTMLIGRGFSVEPKPFSVGVRIEHLQAEIDAALYGDFAGDTRLGHAEYTLSKRVGDRAVYTFCMCPGGEVMAAASEAGGVVTNGMSTYSRSGPNANAAVAVSFTPADCSAMGMTPMQFQRHLEQSAYQMGSGGYRAPMMTVGDFLLGTRGSEPTKVMPTYKNGNGTQLADLSALFPAVITEMLKIGLHSFDRQIAGYAAPYAVLTGPETRTSAPYRILRGENYTALGYENCYPCGEGAGYAGGITSAAVDGIRCAAALMAQYRAPYKDF